AAATENVVNIRAPKNAPMGVSKPVAHDFASISLPIHFFADYAGNKSHPNLFSRDIINLLYQTTGAHPHIRVGGTSADRAIYNSSQSQSIILSEEYNNGIPLEVFLGPVFFEGFENFPGTPWTFQVNLANNKSNALENALAEAEVALKHIKENLVAFEVGNEPDLYAGEVRPLKYSEAEYVQEWERFADAISKRVLRGNPYGLDDWKLFQALTFATKDDGWSTAKAYSEGIYTTGHIKTISLHQYAAGNQPWVRLQNSFMNHTAIMGNLTQYVSDMKVVHTQCPSIPFLLGETNSDYVNLNMAQVEGVFGSSLWLVDYLLYGMTLNISRFNLIQGTTFGYAGWVPVEYNGQEPHVRPPLYGQLVAADVIGRNPTVKIKSLDLGLWNLSAYALYESEILSKYVVINLDEWNTTTTYPRPAQKISISVPDDISSAEARRLVGPGANSVDDISWAGFSWNYTNGRLGRFGVRHSEMLDVNNGVLTVSLPSSQAIVVELKYRK
ncbi:hypothetical protein N7462_011618, partial [Penicillium macrosclerotiorum]|uniref:uncharacterized protein n=1 Tax=Penicillium macrosclerotiorum TaxID=303699 RepID=UPI002546E051